MKTYYFKQDAKKIKIEVSNELYEEMKRLRRTEWRNDFNFKYKHYSLEERMELGWDIADDTLNPETMIVRQEEEKQKSLHYKKLKQGFKTLTKKQINAIILHFFWRMSYSQIASGNNVSKQAIEQRIHSGLKKLRKYF